MARQRDDSLKVATRFAEEVTKVFNDFGPGSGSSRIPVSDDLMTWAPPVDITQNKDELVIRVELPGMDKNDVKVNVTPDAVTVHGERHRAEDEERDSVYWSERNYGGFYRAILLPEGTNPDQTNASFQNGVLEIRMPWSDHFQVILSEHPFPGWKSNLRGCPPQKGRVREIVSIRYLRLRRLLHRKARPF